MHTYNIPKQAGGCSAFRIQSQSRQQQQLSARLVLHLISSLLIQFEPNFPKTRIVIKLYIHHVYNAMLQLKRQLYCSLVVTVPSVTLSSIIITIIIFVMLSFVMSIVAKGETNDVPRGPHRAYYSHAPGALLTPLALHDCAVVP